MVDSKKDTDKNKPVQENDPKDNIEAVVIEATSTICPRCSGEFLCNSADIEHCQCWGVELGTDDFNYLIQLGFCAEEAGCLCRKCLLEIKKAVSKQVQG
jgi:hypothetical protein